jgi:hypothetical protein
MWLTAARSSFCSINWYEGVQREAGSLRDDISSQVHGPVVNISASYSGDSGLKTRSETSYPD